MFLPNSRYAKVATVTVATAEGREVTAVKLRRLPPTPGEPYTLRTGDRLDTLAQTRYADATKFWHVADANTALDSRQLVSELDDSLASRAPEQVVILVPKS